MLLTKCYMYPRLQVCLQAENTEADGTAADEEEEEDNDNDDDE